MWKLGWLRRTISSPLSGLMMTIEESSLKFIMVWTEFTDDLFEGV